MCQAAAKEWVPHKDALAQLGVGLVGVGMGKLGAHYVMDFWPGDLYVDTNQAIHGTLKLPNEGLLSLMAKVNRDAFAAAGKAGFQGDYSEPLVGMQLGATWVVHKGEFVWERMQSTVSDHVSPGEVVAYVQTLV